MGKKKEKKKKRTKNNLSFPLDFLIDALESYPKHSTKIAAILQNDNS